MSPRPTNVDPQIQLVNSLRHGVGWANEILKAIENADPKVSDWNRRKKVVALLIAAAALAQETELDEGDWIELAALAFRGVVIE